MIWRTVFVAWYVAMGFQSMDYVKGISQKECPGHRTAWDWYPTLTIPFTVATWPMAIAWTLVPLSDERVCDRFDP